MKCLDLSDNKSGYTKSGKTFFEKPLLTQVLDEQEMKYMLARHKVVLKSLT